jgi:aprataxin
MCRHRTARALARATRRDRPSARRGARDDVGRAMARERARESATRARDDDVLARDDDGGWAPVKRRDAAATTREGAVATMFERAPRAPVVLVLVGPSGAGKSTFSARLPRERWTTANQDTVSNGKRGTRQQCVRVAKRALEEGKHVVIDRCGLSRQQRADFVALAREARPPCELRAVWFNQPVSVYQQRVRMRTNHPGGVQGESSVRVVQLQMRGKDNAPPTKEEGFRIVRRCRFQDDVDAACAAFCALPAAETAVEFPKKSKPERTLDSVREPSVVEDAVADAAT